MDLISVIVPVYKVETYLKHCVDSILNQTYNNLEVILVDDGSPDNCGAICDEYAAMDNRVRVIHQPNKGRSGARNAGVAAATGQYIAFVDSDDWLDASMYEKLMKKAKSTDADIVKCGYNYTDEIASELVKESDELMLDSKDDILNHYFGNALWIVIWNAVFKAEVVKNVIYPEGVEAEDNYVSFFYLYNAKKVVMLTDCLYFYFKNDSGIRHETVKWSDGKVKIMDVLLRDIEKKNISLPVAIKARFDNVYAKAWFHKIRDDKSITSVDANILGKIVPNLDFRRKMQLKLILLGRKLR